MFTSVAHKSTKMLFTIGRINILYEINCRNIKSTNTGKTAQQLTVRINGRFKILLKYFIFINVVDFDTEFTVQ